ncbi:hypothetical protein GGS23DRAFT_587733 [Durotheca rogersii]|uniref:uncharacterized protein n=1 Tax=Durotheca rogersii TaxID=419775 RepID=UPI0022200A95|nr:uncharacterized protein GGS23DRAFT_587733 [Durotheca rogersii]KAI5857358.1 hypothetical protein GGS23DRAFT_587733 [Durotheca rogersii]
MSLRRALVLRRPLTFRTASTTARTTARMSSASSSESLSSKKEDPGFMEGFRQWKAMGQGGSPLNMRGYLSSLSAEKAMAFGADETIKPGFYDNPEKRATGWSRATEEQKANTRKSFLKEPLPVRPGPRARAKRFVYPQRERNADVPQDPAVKEAYLAAYEKLGETNAEFTTWATSALEKHGRALFLKPHMPVTPLARPAEREIGHIHGTDLSGHVTLSFADAEEVISKGWGERHRMSGTSWIHLGYTMLYVPNTVEETAIYAKIFQAAVDYMKSG